MNIIRNNFFNNKHNINQPNFEEDIISVWVKRELDLYWLNRLQ